MKSSTTKAQRIEAAMADLRRALSHAREHLTAGFQMSRTQFEILMMFGEQPVWTIGELASRLYLTPSAVTQTVDTLVRRELIERRPDDHDRRIIRLQLAPAGHELTQHFRSLKQSGMQALADRLTDAEADALISATQKFATIIHQKYN